MSELVAELKSARVVNHLWALNEDQADPSTVALSQDRETFDAIVSPMPGGTAETGACPRALKPGLVTLPDLGELDAVGDPSHLDQDCGELECGLDPFGCRRYCAEKGE